MKPPALDWRRAVTGWRFAGLCLVLLGVVFVVDRPGLDGGWLYDDIPNIVTNAGLQFSQLTWPNLWHAAFSLRAGLFWRPLAMTTFALEVHWFGLQPFAFKLTNLLIHLANGMLVLALLLQIAGALRETRGWFSDRAGARAFALAVTAAWLLAPLTLSTVLYVVQREVLLATFFTLLGLVGFVRLRRALWRNPRPAVLTGLIALTLGAGALAVAAKESGALLPLYALVLELGLFRFRDRSGRASISAWIYFALLLFLPGAIGTGWLLSHGVLGGYAQRPFTLGQRLLTEPRVLIHYLRWTLAPTLQALGFFHDDIALSTGLTAPATTVPALVGCAGLLAAGVWLLPRRPLLGMGVLWFFAGQALESTFIPLIIAFEHRNYLASLGPLLALAAFLIAEPSLRRLRKPAIGALAVFLGLTAWVSAGRAWEWSSNARLAVYQAAHHPESAGAAYMLARQLTDATLAGTPQLAPQAWQALRHAAGLPGSGLIPYTAMIVLAAGSHRPVRRAWFEAMVTHARSVPLRPTDLSGLAALNRCLAAGPCASLRGRLLALYAALYRAARPRTARAELANLLVLHANAIGYDTAARRARARTLLAEASALQPQVAGFHANLFTLALREGRYAQAQSELEAIEGLNRRGTLTALIVRLRNELAGARRRAPAGATH